MSRQPRSRRLQDLLRRDQVFRSRLLPRLRDCEAGYGTLLFLADDGNGVQLPRYVRDPDADELLAEAMAIATERAALGLDGECIAAQYIDACTHVAGFDQEHRQGPRRLATELLHWLERHAVEDGMEVGGSGA
jgi:hypothetical protein